MTTTYNKSLSSDFSGALNPGQLRSEIEADGGISPTCNAVINVADDVDIIMSSSLSGSEQTTLNNLVASHVPSQVNVGINIAQFHIELENISTTSYRSVGRLNYINSSMPEITHIKVLTYMKNGGGSYDLFVRDLSNDSLIATVSGLDNTEEEITDLGIISNHPSSDATLELSAKVDSMTTTVYLKDAKIYYN